MGHAPPLSNAVGRAPRTVRSAHFFSLTPLPLLLPPTAPATSRTCPCVPHPSPCQPPTRTHARCVLPRVLHVEPVEQLPHLQDFLGGNGNVAGLPLRAAGGLVQHHTAAAGGEGRWWWSGGACVAAARLQPAAASAPSPQRFAPVRQRAAMALLPGSQQQGCHGGRLVRDGAEEEAHGVARKQHASQATGAGAQGQQMCARGRGRKWHCQPAQSHRSMHRGSPSTRARPATNPGSRTCPTASVPTGHRTYCIVS